MEESGGRKFLVMELVSGEMLADRVQRGAIPVAEALGIAIQITEALEAAHELDTASFKCNSCDSKVTATMFREECKESAQRSQ